MQEHAASILVVGAGPVGLSLAGELARRGVRSHVIDAAAAPSPYCRAIGVTPRTLELFEDMGIVREILDSGLRILGRRSILHSGPSPVSRDETIDLSDLPYGHVGVPQYSTEAVLQRHLQRLGIDVDRGCRLAGLVATPDDIVVDLQRGDRFDQARYDYVVGCDGAHSAVRKALGLAFEGDAFPFDFMLGDVAIAWDLPRGMTLQAIRPVEESAPDFFVAIPLPERGRYRVSMLAPAGPDAPAGEGSDHGIQADRPGASLADLQAVADRLLPDRPRLADLRWSSTFRISMRLAERYRVGNVFIAGDACHIHPPTGGQGMNTGIQDACNLAWKLALVVQGRAPPALLDSYEAERRPVAAEVIEDTVRRSVGMGKPAAPPDRLHDTQLLVNYRGGPLAEGRAAGPLAPGDRMPDVQGLRRPGTGFPLRLFDLLRGSMFSLVAFVPDGDTAELEAAMARLDQCYPGLVRAIAVTAAGPASGDPPGIAAVEDPDNALGALFGEAAPAFVLVRPDGYIGLAHEAWSEDRLDAYLRNKIGLCPA